MRRSWSPRALAAWALAGGIASTAARAAIFTVTSTNDGGAGSLRQAIIDANGTPGADLIQFAIPGAGVHTIVTFAPLPVTESVLLDGYSQPGSLWNSDPAGDDAVLQIELLGQGTDGLALTGGSSIVQGLAVQGFQTAVAIAGQAGNVIQGNFIGTDAAGVATFGNVFGVAITGTTGLDRIGDNYPAARNLISGNSTAGIVISGGAGKKILGNLIGTDVSGGAAVPNGAGITLTGSSLNQIGGAPSERNVISGNFGDGISMTDGDSNEIVGNYVGTDATGTHSVSNSGRGIRADGASQNFVIAYNVISGNGGDGVSLAFTTGDPSTAADHVAENKIGTDAAGSAPIGNGGAGVLVEFGTALFVHDNTIAFNQEGVWRTSPTITSSVAISRNSIYANRGLGILTGAGIGANLPLSVYAFPRIVSAVSNGGTTTIQAELSGFPDAMVTLEYFTSPACSVTWPRDFDEGRTYVGSSAPAMTDATGHASFSTDVTLTLTDEIVTATATTAFLTLQVGDGFQGPTYQTSPFSQRLPFSVTPESGPKEGGTGFTIEGTDFQPGAVVQFDGIGANVTVQNRLEITGVTPPMAPGVYGLTVTNPDGTHGTLALGWVSDFDDVPAADLFHDFVVTLASDGITAGVGQGLYGISQPVLRRQMAVFLLKGRHGICYVPPPCIGLFSDVACPSAFADWIEQLAAEGITGGCGGGVFCPDDSVTRQQMAVFLLKAEHGPAYVPPSCVGGFADVPCPSLFADWIEQLAAENVTGGCGGGNYCPVATTTRGQMAVFLVKALALE